MPSRQYASVIAPTKPIPPGMLSSSVAAKPSAVTMRSGRITPGNSCLNRFCRASLTICSGFPWSRYSATNAGAVPRALRL